MDCYMCPMGILIDFEYVESFDKWPICPCLITKQLSMSIFVYQKSNTIKTAQRPSTVLFLQHLLFSQFNSCSFAKCCTNRTQSKRVSSRVREREKESESAHFFRHLHAYGAITKTQYTNFTRTCLLMLGCFGIPYVCVPL